MVASFTGHLLTGPFLRPDIIVSNEFTRSAHASYRQKITLVDESQEGQPQPSTVIEMNPTRTSFTFSAPHVHWSNLCGYIPGVSIVTGSARALLGIAHTIAHVVQSIFVDCQNRQSHLKEAALGLYSISRGMIEALPLVINNFVVIAFDLYRLKKEDARFAERIKNYFQQQLDEAQDKAQPQNI